MEQRLSLITLGVSDLARARAFYEALGWSTGAEPDDDVVFFQAGGIVVALWARARLAEDSAVPDSPGWGGITLAHNVRSPAEVDEVIAQARAARAAVGRALAGGRRLRAPGRPARGRTAVELLRGAADGQRPARIAPCPLASLQGHLSPLPRDGRAAGAAQGRLGLSRAARGAGDREGAGPLEQVRDRGLRHRRVQREVPRIGLPLRRGLEAADRADRRLDRHGGRLRDDGGRLHRVGLVGAAEDLG